MALNPIAYTENIVRSFLRYQLTAYPFAAPGLHQQMRDLLSLDETRQSPLLKGPFISLSQPFRQGSEIGELVQEGLLHPHLGDRIPSEIRRLHAHQERAIRSVAEGRTTLVSTGTGSGKTECFLYPVVSRCLELRDQRAAPGISAVLVYPMNALAEDQLMRLRDLLAGTGVPFGLYVGKTPEHEAGVAGIRMRPGSTRADYRARLEQAQRDGTGETVYPPEEVCSREAMRAPDGQPRILLTNIKQLELLLTRQKDTELFAGSRLDFLVFDEAHTFTGALGAETACLIRRLRAFCSPEPSQTTCIATSATIVDPGDPGAARRFAARFFGVEAADVTTVGEDHEEEAWDSSRWIPPRPANDPAPILERCVRAVEAEDGGAAIRAIWRELTGGELEEGPWAESLYDALARNEIVFRLNEQLAAPMPLATLPAAVEEYVGRTVTEAEILIWLTLGAAAQRDGRTLLRSVVHGFVRGIGGAVVSFLDDDDAPQLSLAAESVEEAQAARAHFPVTTCTTCGQHYFVTHLKDFEFTAKAPGGGEAGLDGSFWPRLDEALGGKRVVLFDRLIGAGDEEDDSPSERTAPLSFCRDCGAAHPSPVTSCRDCGSSSATVRLHAVRQKSERPGLLTSCLSCGATGSRQGTRYREPARPVRASNVADVHVLTQDMVHHAERKRLLVFCDNRQDAAFQAGWMKDHARRFRLRALIAECIGAVPRSVGDLVAWLDDRLEDDPALSRALIPEVWNHERLEGAGVRHRQERRKLLRFHVLREVVLASRQAVGLEPWGRMKIEYDGLDASDPWIQQQAHEIGIPADRFREGIAGVLDYLRRRRALHDPEFELFTKYWQDGSVEVQRGYLPLLPSPVGTKLTREPEEKTAHVIQWISGGGDTTLRQLAGKWGVEPESARAFLTGLFDFVVDRGLLTRIQLKGPKGHPLPGANGLFQVSADRLRLHPNKDLYQCVTCRRTTPRAFPGDRCPAWRCNGSQERIKQEDDNYNLSLLDGGYSMLRPEEHTAMVPSDERERLENRFKGSSNAVNCLVCTPTLELGIDIGQLDSVLMRNVPPLPANYWQRAGRAGRRHRMAVDITYCRPTSHDRAYFADPSKMLQGRIDPPTFNLRNEVMIAKHVRASVIGCLFRYALDSGRPEDERKTTASALLECLPPQVTFWLFEGGALRNKPFDFSPLRAQIEKHAEELIADIGRAFQNGWPEPDADVVASEALRNHVTTFTDELEAVVTRLRRRLRWAMEQIRRLNRLREQQGTLEPADEALFRRSDRLVKRLKGRRGRGRSQAEGHDDVVTFSVLAAEGFLPGYGLETGSVVGSAEIPFWRHARATDFDLPRPPATALREYVPGNLIYANGHRFVARRFRRETGEEQADMPSFEVSREREAVREVPVGGATTLEGTILRTIEVCDTDLEHTSHISDDEELRFQLGVSIYGYERDRHGGGRALRWGPQPVHIRRGVHLRLVNVGATNAIGRSGEFGYPVCAVCGQSVSPLSSKRQREQFDSDHAERCGVPPKPLGFHADVVADAVSLPECPDKNAAYSVLEALRLGATRVLDMHTEDLQILVIGHQDRDTLDALLWDPMPGGSGLLELMADRFGDIVAEAREIVSNCPGACASSCLDCLQSFRNAYYHRFLNREVARERLDEWGLELGFAHDIPPRQPASPGGTAPPVNDAETRLSHLLLAAGFGEGVRGEQLHLNRALGTTTPDIIYRGADDETVCIYLDGMSAGLHGDPATAEKDQEIRSWLRNHGYEVVEIAANQLADEEAMTRHFRRLAGYLGQPEIRNKVKADTSWFPSASA